MHGGAKGSGGQLGNKNAYKHGLYTRESEAMRVYVRKLKKQADELIEKF